MATCARFGWVAPLWTWLAVAMATTVLPAPEGLRGAGKFNPDHQTVDFFAAIDEGQLEVKVIPRDSKQCSLLIKNLSEVALNVAMPDALAAIPALAQFGNNPMGNNQVGNNPFANANRGAPQQLGVGNPFGNRGNMNINNGNPGQLNQPMQGRRDGRPILAPFNVAPEKVARLTLPAVCLEHGKKEPRPSMAYTVKPIDAATQTTQAHEICRMLGRGQLDQRVAQAAAWHLVNDLGWEEMAAKRVRILGYGHRPFFAAEELTQAKDAVDHAFAAAAQREPPILAQKAR